MKQAHPSTLQLDRMALGLEPESSVATHVASCGQCQRYLSTMKEAMADDAPLPPWVEQLAGHHAAEADVESPGAVQKPVSVAPTFAGLRRWFEGLLAHPTSGFAVAALVVVLTFQISRQRLPRTAVRTVRGNPAVALIVKRGERVMLWNEHRRLAPADKLRLEVAPDGMTFVAVALQGPDGKLTMLHAGPVDPSKTSVLPRAWQLDGAKETERLWVVMAEHEVSLTDISRVVTREGPGGRLEGEQAGLWWRVLRLEKATGAEGHD